MILIVKPGSGITDGIPLSGFFLSLLTFPYLLVYSQVNEEVIGLWLWVHGP